MAVVSSLDRPRIDMAPTLTSTGLRPVSSNNAHSTTPTTSATAAPALPSPSSPDSRSPSPLFTPIWDYEKHPVAPRLPERDRSPKERSLEEDPFELDTEAVPWPPTMMRSLSLPSSHGGPTEGQDRTIQHRRHASKSEGLSRSRHGSRQGSRTIQLTRQDSHSLEHSRSLSMMAQVGTEAYTMMGPLPSPSPSPPPTPTSKFEMYRAQMQMDRSRSARTSTSSASMSPPGSVVAPMTSTGNVTTADTISTMPPITTMTSSTTTSSTSTRSSGKTKHVLTKLFKGSPWKKRGKSKTMADHGSPTETSTDPRSHPRLLTPTSSSTASSSSSASSSSNGSVLPNHCQTKDMAAAHQEALSNLVSDTSANGDSSVGAETGAETGVGSNAVGGATAVSRRPRTMAAEQRARIEEQQERWRNEWLRPSGAIHSMFRDRPSKFNCPHCGAIKVVSHIQYVPGVMSYLVAFGLLFLTLGTLSFLPFRKDHEGTKDCVHWCPDCGQRVARFIRANGTWEWI